MYQFLTTGILNGPPCPRLKTLSPQREHWRWKESKMATEVIMPKVDMVMETGTFVEWLKKENEQVSKGDPLFVITTDKAAIEVEAPADGILAGITAKADDIIPVTEVIGYILAPGEALPAKAAAQIVPAAAAPSVAEITTIIE